MTDRLTAMQEAKQRYEIIPGYRHVWEARLRRECFVSGAMWATEREKARAEAAEARVAELEAWAGEQCWHRGEWSFSPRCNQRRDHLIHDGACHGCDSDAPHTHHGFMPMQATDEYAAALAVPTTEAVTE